MFFKTIFFGCQLIQQVASTTAMAPGNKLTLFNNQKKTSITRSFFYNIVRGLFFLKNKSSNKNAFSIFISGITFNTAGYKS